MKFSIVAISKTDASFVGLEKEYLKRLSPFVSMQTVYVPESKNKDERVAQREDESALLAKMNPQALKVVLDARGQDLNSEAFAAWIGSLQQDGAIKELQFFIGGPCGFTESFLKQADKVLSLSQMTFTHQMVRVFFLEQLYRAFSILNNRKYHR